MKKKSLLFTFLALIFTTALTSCNKNNANQINSIEELKENDFIIGVPGFTYCEEQAPIEFSNCSDFRSFTDITSAYKALQQGKIDCFVQDQTMARVEINNGVSGVKILDGKLDMNADIVVGISPKSNICNKTNIDNILQYLIDSSIIDDMIDRWVTNANYSMPFIEMPTGNLDTIVVATCGTVEPYSFFKNGEIHGFDVELSKRIAKKLNVNIEFEINPDFNSLISSVQSGKADLLISNLYTTEERSEQLPLSIPYFKTYGCAIVKDYSNTGILTLEELQNKKIGYDSTSTQFENQVNKYFPNAEHVLFNNTADSVMALQNNRVDAILTDLPNANFIAAYSEGLRVLEERLDPDNYGFCFKKGSPFVNDFNEILEKYKTQHIIDELEEKWFTDVKNTDKKITSLEPGKVYKGTIKAISTAIIEPMCFLDANNNVTGFEVDLLTLICDELDYQLEFLPTVNSFGAVLATLDSSKCDVACNCISITEERKEKYDFSIPYYEGAVAVLVRDGKVNNQSFFSKLKNSFRKTFVVEQRWKMILQGLLVTIIISLGSGILGLLLGFGLCMLRRRKNKPLNTTLKWIIKLIQGTPIVVFLMIMYYVIFGRIDINAIIVAILAFGVNFGVYSCEIMRSGFDSVENGQIEAARALGYSKIQTFFKVTFPQAAKKFIPVLRGEFISMVKMTSIAGYISIMELTRVGDIIRSKTMEAFFPLIVVAIIYFALAELLTFSLTLLEKKLDSKNKPFKIKKEGKSWKKKS